jgi:hypothetical protein
MSSSGSEHRVATRDVAAESRLCNLIYYFFCKRATTPPRDRSRSHPTSESGLGRARYSPRGVLGLENRKEEKKIIQISRSLLRSISKNIHLIRHIRCSVPCGHQGKPSWYTSLKLTDSFLAIYFLFSQCPAELVRRNRLIRPRHLVLASFSLSFSSA